VQWSSRPQGSSTQLEPLGQIESPSQTAMQYCPQSKQPSHGPPPSGAGSIRPQVIVTPTASSGGGGHGVSPSICVQHTVVQNPAAQYPLVHCSSASHGAYMLSTGAPVLLSSSPPSLLDALLVEVPSLALLEPSGSTVVAGSTVLVAVVTSAVLLDVGSAPSVPVLPVQASAGSQGRWCSTSGLYPQLAAAVAKVAAIEDQRRGLGMSRPQ